MIDPYTTADLQLLETLTNNAIDRLIVKRNEAVDNKGVYRYIGRKLENCVGELHRALDKAEKS